MTKHLRHHLEQLERQLLHLAGDVEEAVRRSIKALLERRMGLAERVIEGDVEIDRQEVELEEECLKALALHQPVASDLRFVAACLKIDNDLERIGDLAANIAKRVVHLCSRSRSLDIPSGFADMLEITARMVKESIDSFVRGDAVLARRVCEADDQVDRCNGRIIERLLERMHEDDANIDDAMDYISISKALERIADHATNVAEDVMYLVDGEIVRHQVGKA